MYGGLTMLDRVEVDYVRARRRGGLGRFLSKCGVRSGRVQLPGFDVVRRSLGGYVARGLGIREVAVDDIVGSVGRVRDFEAGFVPKNRGLRGKWMSVDRGYWSGVEFRPISVYKVGGEYYVEDGNHRVSVAKFHGTATIDAEVTEFRPLVGDREMANV